MIVIAQVFDAQWDPGSDVGDPDILVVLEECPPCRRGEYISAHPPEAQDILHVVDQRAEDVLFDMYPDMGKARSLLLKCSQDHIP